MNKTAIAFAIVAALTAGLVATVHADSTKQVGVRSGTEKVKFQPSGFEVPGCAHHDKNRTGYGLKQVCDENAAKGWHERRVDHSGGPSNK